MTHAQLLAEIRRAFGRDLRLFRNETLGAWAGEATRLPDGSTLIRDPRFVQCGLCPGSADLIGWQPGSGRFVAIEVKTGRGRLTQEQTRFIEAVNEQGGVGLVARSVDDVAAILRRSAA